MKKIFIILLFPLIGVAQVPIGETWHDMNGCSHFIYSTSLSMGACGVASIFLKPGMAEITGMFTALSFGVIWELTGNRSIYDMSWNLAGCIVGTGLFILINYIYIKSRQ